jgi:prophage maintenance system killer protein
MDSLKNTARRAGLLWLLATITGGFGLMYVRSNVIVSGDAAATAGNIAASEFLYRAAVVSSLFSQIFMFFLGLTLFHLFKEANKRLATVLLASIMMSVGIAIVNMQNHFGALLVLSQADYLKAFTSEQLNAMAMIYLRQANSSGQGLLEIFWTPYYFSFGLLIIKSRFFPKILGILLIIMGVGFAVNIFEKFLIPQFYPAVFTQIAMMLGALGGIQTMLWLLMQGAKVQLSDDRVS